MPCPFCSLNLIKPYPYPKNIFNGKEFQYIRCTNCQLVYLNNFPGADDYEKMYPPSYQSNQVETSVQPNPYKKLPGLRFSYGYQFDLIKKFKGEGCSILDYGCGTGHFISNANHYGFVCDGAEFNTDYVALLKSQINKSSIYTIDEVINGRIQKKYDVIRLSNVLEHLVHPKDILNKLSSLLHRDGIFLIEGPIEDNFCLANVFRNAYFKVKKILRPKATVSEPPYHIFFSNKKNQEKFFIDCGLKELHFATAEDPWPFPPSFKAANGFKEKFMALIAQLSIATTKTFAKNWGNTFIYCGQIR